MKFSQFRYIVICAVLTLILVFSVQAEETVGGDMGIYRVHCNVDGAMVYFDGELKGEIEQGILDVPIYVTGTPYRSYSVEKPGYYTYKDVINSVPGKGQVLHIYVKLTAKRLIEYGTLHLLVSPAGANVTMDGSFAGVVPPSGVLVLYQVTPGEHTITAEKDGYLPKTQGVFLPGNQVVKVPITLQKIQTGSISVNSVPSGASVYLDGVYRGITPLVIPDIPEGSHAIEIKGDGFQDYASSVEVTGGATSDVSATLTAQTATQPTRAGVPALIACLGLIAAGIIFVRKK